MSVIAIRGARTHNLRHISLDIPRNRLVVITGPSGSGKSSLAFDTLYAEGQRRYVASLSSYARQILDLQPRPPVDSITGLSPAIAIAQRGAAHNPRSTVGTVTEIQDHLRLLYARIGSPHCPEHGIALVALSVSQMVDSLLAQPAETRWMLLAPLPAASLTDLDNTLRSLRGQGFLRIRLDGQLQELDQPLNQQSGQPGSLEVVVDRLRLRATQATRLAESLEVALRLGEGQVLAVNLEDGKEHYFSNHPRCPHCDFNLPPLQPWLFSFNNPRGACECCDGLGVEQYLDTQRLVLHPERSLADGAIPGWDQGNADYFQLLQSLARHAGFSLQSPFEDLPQTTQALVLYGSGNEPIEFDYLDASSGVSRQSHPFQGIVEILARRRAGAENNRPQGRLTPLDELYDTRSCSACGGTRLCRAARHVLLAGSALPALTTHSVDGLRDWFSSLVLDSTQASVAEPIVVEIRQRLEFLQGVGLGYLSLDRPANTLSGGEYQRIRLAGQIGAALVGVMYVLDEPSIGLHQRDNHRLLASLCRLRDLGNSVIVVEHDEDTIRCADHVVDMGPGAGEHGGLVVASGTPAEISAHPDSLTGAYLSGRLGVPPPPRRREADPHRQIRIQGIRLHNLHNLSVSIPLGLLVCVSGVSGSGKSSLVNDTLYPLAASALNGARLPLPVVDSIHGLDHLQRVVQVDQRPIGRTPRSNPATYTGLFTPLRELYASTPEARSRGYSAARFSFNVRGGRCEACQGDGLVRVEMHFLPDVFVPCQVCGGRRYNRETLEVRYRGLNIHEALELSVTQAVEFFNAIPAIARRLQTLQAVGLGYLRLGQMGNTLSGGEAQRVKLARELSRRDSGRSLYILDEPTTGLHFHDVAQLLGILQQLCEQGNSVVVIEHNLELIRAADWVLDLGPGAGEAGGRLVVAGPPEVVAGCPQSDTGHYLARRLNDALQGSSGSAADT